MSKEDGPQAPPPPDPYKTAQAQLGTNIQTGIANSVMGNVNQVGPTGSTIYNQSGTQTITGPDGQTYQVPRYTQTTQLSPEQQQLYIRARAAGSGQHQCGWYARTAVQPFRPA